MFLKCLCNDSLILTSFILRFFWNSLPSFSMNHSNMQSSVPAISTISSSVASRMRDDVTSLINDERLYVNLNNVFLRTFFRFFKYDFLSCISRYGVLGRKFGHDTHTARSQTPLPPDQDCSIELLCHIKVRGEGNINLDVCNQSSPLVAKWRGAFFSTPQTYDICLFVVVLEREVGKTDWHEIGRTEVIENLPANIRDLSFLRVIRTSFLHSRQTELRFELWNSSFFGKKDHERIWTEEKLRGIINADPLANMNHLVWQNLKRQKEAAKKCSSGRVMQKSEEDARPIEAKLAGALDGANMVSERRQEVAAYFESDLPEKNTTIRLPQGIFIAYSTCLLSDIIFARTKRIVPLEMKSVLDRTTPICTLMAEGRSRIAKAQYVQFEIRGQDFISPESVAFHQAPNIFFMVFSEIDKKVTLQYVSELRPKSYSTRWWPFTICIDRLISDSIYEHSIPRLYATVMHKPKTVYIKGTRQLDSAKMLSSFDIDLKKLATHEGELLHLYSLKTSSGIEINEDRSYATLNARLKESMKKVLAAGVAHSTIREELEQQSRELQQSIEKSIQDGTSASISVRMLRKKSMSGNHKPRSFKDRATENDGTMLQELSELSWLDSTYTEQVRKALSFLNEQDNYWTSRTYFDEQEHASKFFVTSPQNSPRNRPFTVQKSSHCSLPIAALAGTHPSLGTCTSEKRVPSLKLNSTILQYDQSPPAAPSARMLQDYKSGSKAFQWLHRVSATASSRIIGNRVISGFLEEHSSPLASMTPRALSASSCIQTPREQIIATHNIANYLTNKCGITMSPRKKAADSIVEFHSETARSIAATEADALQPQQPSVATPKQKGSSPLQQLRQRHRAE